MNWFEKNTFAAAQFWTARLPKRLIVSVSTTHISYQTDGSDCHARSDRPAGVIGLLTSRRSAYACTHPQALAPFFVWQRGRQQILFLSVDLLESRTLLSVITPFTPRFTTNATGDIAIVANTSMTAPASDPAAGNAARMEWARRSTTMTSIWYSWMWTTIPRRSIPARHP